jgi:hypothetical protein
MGEKVECERCKKTIDRDHDLHVSLGTHDGKELRQMVYFHFNCWRQHFEEKTREKAQVIVNAMQEKMMPIAKQMTERLKDAIGSNGDQVVNLN